MERPVTPSDLVRDFLRAMEARDLDRARGMLDPDFSMRFPGAPAMTDLDDLLDWSRGRYATIGKTFEGVEEVRGGDAVWAYGTLSGTWPDGRPFEGIRFVDRFEVEGGRILRQDVYNDMAIHRSAGDGVAE